MKVPRCVQSVTWTLDEMVRDGRPQYWVSPTELANAAGVTVPMAHAALRWLSQRRVVVWVPGVRCFRDGVRKSGPAFTIPVDFTSRLNALQPEEG